MYTYFELFRLIENYWKQLTILRSYTKLRAIAFNLKENRSERFLLLLRENPLIRIYYCFISTFCSRSTSQSPVFLKSESFTVFSKTLIVYEKIFEFSSIFLFWQNRCWLLLFSYFLDVFFVQNRVIRLNEGNFRENYFIKGFTFQPRTEYDSFKLHLTFCFPKLEIDQKTVR